MQDDSQVPRIFVAVAVRWWATLGLLNGVLFIGYMADSETPSAWLLLVGLCLCHGLVGAAQGFFLFLGQNQELDRSPATVVRARGTIVAALTGVAWGGIAGASAWALATGGAFWTPSHLVPVMVQTSFGGFVLGLFLNRRIWSVVDMELNG